MDTQDSKLSGPLTWPCDTVHALDNKMMAFAENQGELARQVAKVNARLENFRGTIQDMHSGPQHVAQDTTRIRAERADPEIEAPAPDPATPTEPTQENTRPTQPLQQDHIAPKTSRRLYT